MFLNETYYIAVSYWLLHTVKLCTYNTLHMHLPPCAHSGHSAVYMFVCNPPTESRGDNSWTEHLW